MTARMAALLVLFASASARADSLGTARDQALREVAHTVDIRVENGVATYVVQRRFENRGNQADEVRLAIDLPRGAAATGLRIRAKTRWHRGELLEREAAADKYRELTGMGVYDPRDPALLFWQSSTELFLQMFPVMPKTVSTVEYTLTVPTEYRGGRYQVTYPKATRLAEGDHGIQLVDPVITVRGATAITVDGKQAHVRTRLPAPGDAGVVTDDPDANAIPDTLAAIAIPPQTMRAWEPRLARVVASDQHAFTRFELDLAPQLSALPRNAQVVFAIDASHSAGHDLIEAQLAIARAYAHHVPDAQIELVVYRRAARRVFGRFVPAPSLASAIQDAARRGMFAPGNGSALDEGARLAAAALATRTGPRRIVLMTDELVRTALAEADALQPLAGIDPSTIVHVVSPSLTASEASLQRADDAALAPLATTHHGIFASLAIHGGDAALAKTVLELVRPIRIDQLALSTDKLAIADTLREGEGIRVFEALPPRDAPARLSITGKLWSDPIAIPVAENAAFTQATAGFVFGADLHGGLSDAEMMTVARAGRAVSPVTSYLAIEPGVRPSKIGLDGGTGWGAIGAGRYGTIGHGIGVGNGYRRPDLAALVDTTACVQQHRPAAGWSVKLEVETTKDEIVDVTVRNGAEPMASCLVEATWRVRLDSRFVQTLDHHVIDLL